VELNASSMKVGGCGRFLGDWTKGFGYSLFVVGDGQVVVTALRSSLPQVR
jgi:hypothetical protein